jgi:hypothetical protein
MRQVALIRDLSTLAAVRFCLAVALTFAAPPTSRPWPAAEFSLQDFLVACNKDTTLRYERKPSGKRRCNGAYLIKRRGGIGR